MKKFRLIQYRENCIGCNACVAACAECDTHAGVSMIHLVTVERGETVAIVGANGVGPHWRPLGIRAVHRHH